MCKFWKINGFATERHEGEKFSDHARREHAEEDLIWDMPEGDLDGLPV